MAYDKVVNSAALEAALKASADAIREKTGDTATIPWDAAKGFADAIAAIETGGGGGNVILGEVIPSSGITTIDLHEYGISSENAMLPRARFLFESDTDFTDNTHTKGRVVALIAVCDCVQTNDPTKSYVSVQAYQSSGSNTYNKSAVAISNMWGAPNPATGSPAYNIMNGCIRGGVSELYIADPTRSYGPIAGRKYVWGIII